MGHDSERPTDPFQQSNQVSRLVFRALAESSQIAEHHRDVTFARFEQRGIEFVSQCSQNRGCEELPQPGLLPLKTFGSDHRTDDFGHQFRKFDIRFELQSIRQGGAGDEGFSHASGDIQSGGSLCQPRDGGTKGPVKLLDHGQIMLLGRVLFPDMQDTRLTAFQGFRDEAAAGAEGACGFVSAIPMQHLDIFGPRGGDDCHPFGMHNPFEQQIRQPMVQFVIVPGTGNHFGQMGEHFDPVFRILVANFA